MSLICFYIINNCAPLLLLQSNGSIFHCTRGAPLPLQGFNSCNSGLVGDARRVTIWFVHIPVRPHLTMVIRGHNLNGVSHAVSVLRSYVKFFLQWLYKIRKLGPKKNCANYHLLHNTSETMQFTTAYFIPNTVPKYFFKIHFWTKIQYWSQILYTILWNTTTNTKIVRSNTHLHELLFTA